MASDTSVRAHYVAWPHALLPENDLKQLTDPFSTACCLALYPIFKSVHGEGYFAIYQNVLRYSPKTQIPIVDDIFSYFKISPSALSDAVKRTWYGNGEWETRVISASIRILATYKVHDAAIRTLLGHTANGIDLYASDRYGDRGGGALLRLTSKIIRKSLRVFDYESNSKAKEAPPQRLSASKDIESKDIAVKEKTPQEERIAILLPTINEILKEKRESTIGGLLAQVESQQNSESIAAKDSEIKVQLDSLLTLFSIYSTLKPGALVMNGRNVLFVEGGETSPDHLLIFAKILKNAELTSSFPQFKELLGKALIGVMEYQKKFCGKPSQVQALALSEVSFDLIHKFGLNIDLKDLPEITEDHEEYAKKLTTLWQPSNFENVVKRINEVMENHSQRKVFKPVFDGLAVEFSTEQETLKEKLNIPFPAKEGKRSSVVPA